MSQALPINAASSNWLLWQLADSAFPTGGFAHSGGLEAAMQAGEVSTAAELEQFLIDALHQAGWAFLPVANSAYDAPENLETLDQICDSFLSNHVSNRASRVQGRALLSACEKSFPVPAVLELAAAARDKKLARHLAPLWGALLKLLEIPRRDTQQLALFLTLRGILSAGVRLGLTGPFQAQQIQYRLGHEQQRVLAQCSSLTVDDLAQTAPLLDLFQGMQDRLYSRLFQT